MKSQKLLIVIDMNNGFAKEGPLSSPNVEKIIFPIKTFIKNFKEEGNLIAYYSDAHSMDDEEFKLFPPHCLKGTKESKFVDELRGFEDFYIEKDTTDGFYAKNPIELLENSNGDIYVCGCVTEICVKNFTCSLLNYIKQKELKNNVIVISDLVTTFDGPNNDAIERHNNALEEMKNKGAIIKSTKQITNVKNR